MTPPVAAIVVAVLLAFPACGVQGLNFRQDKRLTITAPADRGTVKLPVSVTWQVHDFEITGRDGRARPDAGYFGVYVDQPPQPPERTQEWLLRDDERCRATPSCPDEAYLAQLDIFSTTDTQFTIERLPVPPTDAQRRREFHEVTIVLLNGRGERIGESAFTRLFEVDRDA